VTDLAVIPESSTDVLAWALEQLPAEAREQGFASRDLFLAIMGKVALPQTEESGSINGMLARVLAAPDVDTAILGQGTATIERVLGRPVSIDNPRWYPSEYAGGPLCFTVVEAVDMEDGTVEALVVGSQHPQLVIWRAWLEGRLPLVVKFVKATKPTAAGFYPYNIVAP
jgi:hypothetical protein